MKYKAFGQTTVYVEYTCEAKNGDEALDIAAQEIGGLVGFCGNGGIDKLVGIDDSNGSIDAPDDIEWEWAEPIEGGE